MYAFQILNSKFLIQRPRRQPRPRQRALAAARAISRRRDADNRSARARPPPAAPRRVRAEAAQRRVQRILAWLDRHQQFFAHDVGRRMAPRALGFITGALDRLTVPFAHRALAADESPDRLHDTIVIRNSCPGTHLRSSKIVARASMRGTPLDTPWDGSGQRRP